MSSDGEEEQDFFEAAESAALEDHVAEGANKAEGGMSPIGQSTTRLEAGATLAGDDGQLHQEFELRQRNNTTINNLRSRSTSRGRSSNRYSLPAFPSEPVPLIPAKYLEFGRPSVVQQRSDDSERREGSTSLHILRRPATTRDPTPSPRPTKEGATQGGSNAVAPARPSQASDARERPTSLLARRKSLPPQFHKNTLDKLESTPQTQDKMSRLGQRKNEDLFLELANNGERDARPPSRGGERTYSRLSYGGKRSSMPTEHALPSSTERRPKSSGQAFANRPASRLDTMSANLQRHVDRYRASPSRSGYRPEDTASTAGRSQSGHVQRWSSVNERSPATPSVRERVASPESLQYGRGRPSYGITQLQPQKTRQSKLPGSFDEHSESPGDSSEPKQSQHSTDADSNTEDTVWDELDELKSRIKKLELTGKSPSTSGGAMSNETSERPRTATTAPTTIDSSPKREKQEKKEGSVSTPAPDSPMDYTVGGPSVSNIHPLLHSALAKAKPILNSALYRTLEATASDAMQLAAMTGGAGPQGTAFSAASIINGATVSDRHVRRKADTMCRNLTDLCLAICEGKQDGTTTAASPATLGTPFKDSPSMRYARSSLGGDDSADRATTRPMSRLEARRSSIFGSSSRRESAGDLSASEQESTPSHPPQAQERQRFSRAGSRLQVRQHRFDEGTSGDEDPTIRPLSRAVSNKPSGPRDYHSPGSQRSPSLRESLVARRSNAGAHDDNRRLSRVSSMNSESGGRRRFLEHSTPPVLEEESSDAAQEYEPSNSASRRRVTSYAYGNRRDTAEMPNRAMSLNQRRHVVVE